MRVRPRQEMERRRRNRRRIGSAVAVVAASPLLMAFSAAHAATAPSGASVPAIGVYPGARWDGPVVGFNNSAIDQTITPVRLTGSQFWSTQTWIGNPDTPAYEGIQTTGSLVNGQISDMALFSLWNAIDATPGPGSVCIPFGGEGTGLTCRAPIDVVAGHAYNVHIGLDHVDGANGWWHGTVTDTTTGEVDDLGVIEAPNNGSAYGPVNFMENFGDHTGLACDQYPYSVGDFDTPMLTPSSGGEAVPATLRTTFDAPHCGELGNVTITPAGVHVEYGGPLPTNVKGLSGSLQHGNGRLGWTNPISDGGSPILDIRVEGSIDGGSTFTLIKRVPAGSTTTTLSGVDPRTNAIRVAAENAAGIGAFSNIIRLASPPTIVKVVPGSRRATITFTPATDGSAATVTGYQITAYVKGVPRETVTFKSTATTETLTGLKNGTTYTFAIAAINASGSGPFSAVSVATKVGAPAAPTLVKALRVGRGRLRVTFVAGATNGARIARYTATCTSSNGGTRKTATSSTRSIKIAGLTLGKRYTCTVTATNANGTSPISTSSATVTA